LPGRVKIEWAIVAGTLSHISEFVGVPIGKRPPAACEKCGSEMIMKLGTWRAHHFAHNAAAECPLYAPETALHYNAVRRLSRYLRSRPDVTATMRCADNEHSGCRETITEQIGVAWDETIVEARLPAVGPDILLTSATAPVLAIEVRACNPVSRAKAMSYARLGLAWIEITAQFIMHEWTPGEPLMLIEQHGALSSSLCSLHAERARPPAAAPVAPNPVHRTPASDRPSPAPDRRMQAVPLRLPESIRRLPPPDLGSAFKFRIVDWYRSYGVRNRKLYRMYKVAEADGWVVCVVEHPKTEPIVCVGPEPVLEDAFRQAREAFDRFLASRGNAADSPMHWVASAKVPAEALMNDTTLFPPRFRLAYSPEVWSLAPRYAELRWPADLARTEDGLHRLK
jgi:hypothetical protein